jgi:hypothetical protein
MRHGFDADSQRVHGRGAWPALPRALSRLTSVRIVRTAVVAIRHAITVAVPARVAVVGTAVVTIVVGTVVMTGVIAMPCDVRRGRWNNDHVRAMAAVSMVRLSLSRSAQCAQCDYGCSAECEKHLLHGSSFEELYSGAPILRAKCEGQVRLERNFD